MSNQPQDETPQSLPDLGNDEDLQTHLARILHSTRTVIVAGATGSGKVTFLGDVVMKRGRKSNSEAIQSARQACTPYYRQFDKRKYT
ncbi:hypothetical protein A8H39_01865 [Paraburkholderia fungorum]|uniref:hypothetical protein n=1 Tax=Paraburkholderia fungorum TaxID=134537 RepID=UPI0005A9FEF0|nr:hypothetical protein [Paraburkholderia fungorum]PNE59918.1 hypothetical protein A8H39_01865 [Paraburkholderia fungorum]